MDDIVLIAVGSRLRRDDAVAHRVLELLGPGMGRTASVTQLTPELAAELGDAAVVVVIDADASATTPSIEPIPAGAAAATPLGHAMRPEEVLALARGLYGFRGRMFRCRVPAADLSPGTALTGRAERAAAAAAGVLRAFAAAP